MAAKAPVKKNLSAIKRARQAEKRNIRNRVERSKIKSAMKIVEITAKSGDKEAAANVLKSAAKLISSARSKGIIHKNNAARKISKLTRKVNAVSKA